MKRKVFISYYHKDHQEYKDKLSVMLSDMDIEDNSVTIGKINDKGQKKDNIYRMIRDDYISGSDVVIVLLGLNTWKRKHVDREIGAGLMDTEFNPRCGLVIIRLPEFLKVYGNNINQKNAGRRINENIRNDYAVAINWPNLNVKLVDAIEEAIDISYESDPNNSAPYRSKNSK